MNQTESDYKPHRCDFCSGTVRGLVARSEPLPVLDRLVLLEDLVIGKCDHCGHRYFRADIVKWAERVVRDPQHAANVALFPVIAA